MSYDWHEVARVVHSEGWAVGFTVEPPADPAAIAALEARLGGPLPAAYRSFVTEVTGAIGGLHLNRPDTAVEHLIDPAAAFPDLPGGLPPGFDPRRCELSPDEAADVIARLGELLADTDDTDSVIGASNLDPADLDELALTGNDLHQGAVLALDLGCGEYVAVIHDGPLRDTVWRVTEAGWTPECHLVDGAWVAHDFASFLRSYVETV